MAVRLAWLEATPAAAVRLAASSSAGARLAACDAHAPPPRNGICTAGDSAFARSVTAWLWMAAVALIAARLLAAESAAVRHSTNGNNHRLL